MLEYDGTRYVGWQKQKNGPSIQGEIEKVLGEILQEPIYVIGAGRTDAGVHARGQTAHFLTASQLSAVDIKRGLNGLLPDDIIALDVTDADMDFHARYSARERQYSYHISQVPTALIRNHSWFVKYPLDKNLLEQTADKIIGQHDFRSFCKTGTEVENYLCTVTESRWDCGISCLKYTISANRFLRGMVRGVVGTMMDVARGYISLDDFVKIFESKNRCEAGASAPARGLVLEKVIY